MFKTKGKKKWVIIIIAAVVVVAVIIGIVVWQTPKSEEPTMGGTIDYVTRRTIANSISGNGTIEAVNTESVMGGSFGMTIETIAVEVGDVVSAGDLICTFNTESIDEQIASIQESISDTKKSKSTQLAEYDKQIADVNSANTKLIENATESLTKAQADLTDAQTELEETEKKYNEAKNTLDQQEAVLLEYEIAAKKSSIESIQSRIDTYELQITSLKNQDTASLEAARKTYSEQMNTLISTLEDQLKTLQEQKDGAIVYAGISGTVTAVNVSVGGTYYGGGIATIEAVDQFMVEAQVEEYDVADIAVGMKVLVKTDATRDEELEGVITYIAPRATNSASDSLGDLSSIMGIDASSITGSSGSATYLVKIALLEQNERLRLGMNAKIGIITEERADVWSVPYDAVYTREDGTTYVEKVTGEDEDGNILTEEMEVTVGIQGTYYVEIISSEITDKTQILVPDAQGSSSIEELLNMMGADAGI